MKFFGTVLNPEAGKKAAARIQKKADNARKVALFTIAAAIHETAIELINDNGDGTPVKKGVGTHHISKPGDPPNTDTGRLVQSIRFEFTDGARTALIGTNLKYGAYLEFGTLNIAPRPWLSKAFELETKNAVELFSDAYKKG